jgi:hypothetical protein
MAKQKIPTTIQNKFKRELYKVGEYVYFNWLGQKEYGYITRIYQSSGTTTYMVQGKKYRYPCGVQIKTYRSGTDGYIFYEQTREFGQDEIRRRFESRTVSQDSTRTKRTQSSKDKVRGGTVKATNNEVSQPKRAAEHRTKNDDKSGNTANSKGTTTRRRKSYSKLDEAVQKQKDFLRKFT